MPFRTCCIAEARFTGNISMDVQRPFADPVALRYVFKTGKL
jgi:hypothetical protein